MLFWSEIRGFYLMTFFFLIQIAQVFASRCFRLVIAGIMSKENTVSVPGDPVWSIQNSHKIYVSNKLLKIANETFKSQQLDNPFFFSSSKSIWTDQLVNFPFKCLCWEQLFFQEGTSCFLDTCTRTMTHDGIVSKHTAVPNSGWAPFKARKENEHK